MSNHQELSAWVGSQLVVPKAKEVLLVLLLVDDSGSIQASGNTAAVIEGVNGFLDSLAGAIGEVRGRIMFLGGHCTDVVFHPAAKIHRLSLLSYFPVHQTPLYRRSVDALNAVLNESNRLAAEGFTVRTMTLIFTDGGDNASQGIGAEHVKVIVDLMLKIGGHIIGACAVSDRATDFWKVFARMGIPEHWIKVLKGGKDISGSMSQMGSMASDASVDHEAYMRSSRSGFRPPKP